MRRSGVDTSPSSGEKSTPDLAVLGPPPADLPQRVEVRLLVAGANPPPLRPGPAQLPGQPAPAPLARQVGAGDRVAAARAEAPDDPAPRIHTITVGESPWRVARRSDTSPDRVGQCRPVRKTDTARVRPRRTP